jgi:hypothetical protein
MATYGKKPPCLNTLHDGAANEPGGLLSPEGLPRPAAAGATAETGHLVYPVSVRDPAERGMG